MADNRNQENRGIGQQPQYQQGNKPMGGHDEAANKPGKQGYEERERERAGHPDKSQQDNSPRKPGSFPNDPNKGGQR